MPALRRLSDLKSEKQKGGRKKDKNRDRATGGQRRYERMPDGKKEDNSRGF